MGNSNKQAAALAAAAAATAAAGTDASKAVDTSTTDTSVNTETTTASGDSKGELQTIVASDVGSLSAVLGDMAGGTATGDTGAEQESKAAGTETTTTAPTASPEASAVTTSQRAAPVANPTPTPVQTGTTDSSSQSTTVLEVPKKTIQAGVVVKATAADGDEQLPEVVAAQKVATMQSNSALIQIQDYVRDMHPAKPQNVASIEANQVKLLNALYSICIAEDTNFGVVFKAVIAIVKAHRNDAFKVTMRNRGLNGVSMATIDNKNMRFLTRLVDTLHVASGLNDISKVKEHVDMSKLFESIANVRARNNLTAFFS